MGKRSPPLITKVTKFETPDGEQHETYGAARTHISKSRFRNWMLNVFRGMAETDPSRLREICKIIEENWHMTPRKTCAPKPQ